MSLKSEINTLRSKTVYVKRFYIISIVYTIVYTQAILYYANDIELLVYILLCIVYTQAILYH